MFIGRTDAEVEAQILWPSDWKSLLVRKDSNCQKRLKTGVEGDDRARDSLMASLTQWTLV